MNEIIRQRKSIRKYEKTPLAEAMLDKVREKMADLKPLYPDIPYAIDIVDKTKGLLPLCGDGWEIATIYRIVETVVADNARRIAEEPEEPRTRP